MAFDTLTAKLTPLELTPGCVIKLEAIDAATGAAVANVSVSAVSIWALDLAGAAGGGDGLPTGPFMLVPGPAA